MTDTDQPKRKRRTKEEIAEEKRRWLLRHEWQGSVKASEAMFASRQNLDLATIHGVRPQELQDKAVALLKELDGLYREVLESIPGEARE